MLHKKVTATNLAELQAQIDRFAHVYNAHTSPACRALDSATIQIGGTPPCRREPGSATREQDRMLHPVLALQALLRLS
jgi:hypothetical protein